MIHAVQVAVRFLDLPDLTEAHLIQARLILTGALKPEWSSGVTVDLEDHVDGGKYLEVWVHNRNDKTVEVVREAVENAIREGIGGEIDVEVWMYAGTPEP